MRNSLIYMAGPEDKVDLSKLSNFEVGVLVMDQITHAIPGLTWGQLYAMASGEKMAGPFDFVTDLVDDVGSAIMKPIRGATSVVMDGFRTVGHAGMEFMRDQKVQDNIKMAYQGFAESGGVAGFFGGSNFFGGGGGGGGNSEDGGGDFMDWLNGFLSQVGGSAKAQHAGMFSGGSLPWLVAGGAVLVLIFGKRA